LSASRPYLDKNSVIHQQYQPAAPPGRGTGKTYLLNMRPGAELSISPGLAKAIPISMPIAMPIAIAISISMCGQPPKLALVWTARTTPSCNFSSGQAIKFFSGHPIFDSGYGF
jgi:hypothetical protein